MNERRPLVILGMPVYNGSNYVAAAIEAILAQTFTDFELLICDNASTDDTEQICRRYAAGDERIRYHRNERNIGAGPNFNLVFEMAKGRSRYFKWCSHDDLLAPSYLERCIAALEANPDAVLCQSLVRRIDADGTSLGVYDSELHAANARSVSKRFAALITARHWATETFGVVRSDALAKTILIQPYFASDQATCAELALLGRFVQVPEPLFMNRDHPSRCVRSNYTDRRAARRWYLGDAATKPRLSDLCHLWMLYVEYWRMVRRHVPGRTDRLFCYTHLIHWPFIHWYGVQLLLEPISAYDPRIMDLAAQVKKRLFGQARVAFTDETNQSLRH